MMTPQLCVSTKNNSFIHWNNFYYVYFCLNKVVICKSGTGTVAQQVKPLDGLTPCWSAGSSLRWSASSLLLDEAHQEAAGGGSSAWAAATQVGNQNRVPSSAFVWPGPGCPTHWRNEPAGGKSLSPSLCLSSRGQSQQF